MSTPANAVPGQGQPQEHGAQPIQQGGQANSQTGAVPPGSSVPASATAQPGVADSPAAHKLKALCDQLVLPATGAYGIFFVLTLLHHFHLLCGPCGGN